MYLLFNHSEYQLNPPANPCQLPLSALNTGLFPKDIQIYELKINSVIYSNMAAKIMASATNRTSDYHDSKYHSKRLRDLLLSKSYQKPASSIHVIKTFLDYEMSLEAKLNPYNKVEDVFLK